MCKTPLSRLGNFHIRLIMNCNCITYTIYKKLLNVRYRLMEAKRIEMSSLFRAGFKRTEISKQLNVSRMTLSGGTTFEDLRVHKGSSSIRKSPG